MGYAPHNQDVRNVERRGEVIFMAHGRNGAMLGRPTDKATQAAIASGSSFELFAGLIAAVVAVIGIAGYFPIHMAATATIAVGFSLLAQGGTLAARWQDADHIPTTERTEAVGIGTEVLGGFAGISLGVMSLLGVVPLILLPVSAIVLGAALLFGGPTQPQIAEAAPDQPMRRYRVTRDAVRTSSSVMVMAGLAAIVLGVLGLATVGYTSVMALIAMLCIAGALMLAGGTLTARFARRFA